MKRLAYIGLKADGERAFQDLTGIEWMPGAEHDVKDEHAELMVKHTDVWREVQPKTAALKEAARADAKASQTEEPDPVLPEWVKKGVELGATDDQLEAIAQAGGPLTEAGAALWKDFTGTEWKLGDAATSTVASKPAAKAAKKAPAKKTTRKGAKTAAKTAKKAG